jgi:hypothetical protein
MTGRPLIGLIMALLVEARHWTRFRWEFDDEACGRAWQFSSIAIAIAAVLIWLDGNRYTALPNLLSWLPPLLLPMQFVQSYGMRDSMPLSAFSFLARRRRARNQRLGLPEESTEFNFGNVLFATTLVASTVGSNAQNMLFLPGVVVLTGWLLLSAGRSRPLALLPVLVLAGLLAHAGQWAIERAEEWIGRAANPQRGRFDPNYISTMIGSRGPVQQSPDIIWRLRLKPGSPPPQLLRTGSFNTFLGTNWQNQRVAITDFKDLDTRLSGERPIYLLQDVEVSGQIESLPAFILRGGAIAESPLPLPGDSAGLTDFELDGIERNTFGTVRVFPKHSVIEGTVFWRGGTNPESPPLVLEDLRIPIAERQTIKEIVEELNLSSETELSAKLAILRTWFHQKFRYTRNLTIRHPGLGSIHERLINKTALSRFLTTVRAGHCEYFATAAALILRESGVPTRYATGYAVMERDAKRNEFVLRGTHGHAWCRVWDPGSGLWLDFDPTPPDWFASVSQQPPITQVFNDWLKRLREDFFLWRNRPTNRLMVSLTMVSIGLLLTAFVTRRLWRSKKRLEVKRVVGRYQGPHVRTALHELEPHARKHLGERPPGQPFAGWLAGLRPALPESHLLDEALALHQRLRFDPEPAPPGQHERLAALASQLASILRHHGGSRPSPP